MNPTVKKIAIPGVARIAIYWYKDGKSLTNLYQIADIIICPPPPPGRELPTYARSRLSPLCIDGKRMLHRYPLQRPQRRESRDGSDP